VTVLLLAACTDASLSFGDSPAATPHDSGDSGLASLGPAPDDTAGADTSVVPPTTNVPGLATMACAASPPVDGKTPCTLHVEGPDGAVYYDGPAGVGLHGRSSANFPKQQFAVELRDDTGAEAEADLFGMGKEADWILNGMWIDRALLRNKFGYDLFVAATHGREYAPESRYVELTYNGGYYGVYAVTERVDHGKARVDIPADDGTGGSFIVKADETGIPSVTQYGSWSVQYPAEPTPAQTAGVTARLAAIEGYITYADPTMWDEIDLDSAVAFVLVEELCKNNDGYFLSHHAWSAPGDKLHLTPWDLDLTLGQPNYNDNENPQSWIAYRPAFIGNMAQTQAFQDRLVSMWAEWRAGAVTDEGVDAWIDTLVADLGDAVDRNFERWPMADVDFGGTLYRVDTHPEEIARVKTFLHARIAWMDDNVALYLEEAP
jgi:hypothetical protein